MAKIFRKPRASTVIFYGALLVVILAFYLFMSGLMGKLKLHLEDYQAAHINTQYRIVFQEHFGDPDWAALYDEAGLQDTAFEGKQAFAEYMRKKVGDQELICFLESNGTSGKKCPVYLGDEELGVFYMASAPEVQPETQPWYYKIPFAKSLVSKLSIQSWHYDGLTLNMPKRELSVTVTTEDNRIVYVNGVALGDEQRTSYTCTQVEAYLPEGLQGMRRQSFYQDGFLVKPVVTVTDLEGNPIEITEEAPGHYTEIFATQEIEPELEAFIIAAAQTYSRYMVRDAYQRELAKYYDTSSKHYYDLINADLWAVDPARGTRMGEATVTEFYRYSDSLVTARVTTVLYAGRHDGLEREYPLDTTFFLKKTESGEYRIYDASNKPMQQTTTLVRLRFFVNGELTETMMVDAAASQLTLFQVEVPQGKRFAGWYQATTDENGRTTLSLIFLPKEGENTVYIPADTDLAPMDLQAVFE